MKSLKYVWMFVVLIFIGCGGGSSSSSSTTSTENSFEPSVALENISKKEVGGDITTISGDITFKENSSSFSNVIFSNIIPSSTECSIKDYNVTPVALTSSQKGLLTINFEAGCRSISAISFKADERGDYMDGDLKTKTETISLTKDVNITSSSSSSEGGSSSDTTSTISKLVVIPSYIKVAQPSQTQEFTIYTLDSNNRPVAGKVRIAQLLDNIDSNPQSFGTLDKYEVQTQSDGTAKVVYTAPNDLSGLDGNKTINFSVENSSLTKTSTLDFTSNSDDNSSATTYIIKTIVPNSFAVDMSDNLSIQIVKKSNENIYIDNADVHNVKVVSQNHLIYFDKNQTKTETEYSEYGSKTISIWSGKYSGIDFVDINATIFNGEENVTISQQLKVVVLSGPISALSINYLSTTYDSDTGLFVNKYAVHAVDRYSNPANKGSKIYFGAINGVKVYADENGSIGIDNGKSEFNVTNINLDNKGVEELDTLIVLAGDNRLDENYLGGWLIDDIVDSDTISFKETYSGDSTNNLTFAIGNEKRYDRCDESVRVIDFDSTDGTYEIDDKGIAYITAKYDPFLVGHTVFFYANAVDNQRVGTSLKTILFGTGIDYPGEISCSAEEDKNTTCEVIFAGFTSNGIAVKGAPLRGTFALYDDKGSCRLIDESNVTACDGSYVVSIDIEKNTTCTVRWTSAVDYEH